MTLTLAVIEALAPDQSSLKAATQQLKPSKWPVRGRDAAGGLVWGECQGSGANPYRVVVDLSDHGSKCTCPSRKFPCKHALALMLMAVEGPAAFAEAPVPDWIGEWMSRRRRGTAAATPPAATPKSLAEARAEEPSPPADPQAEERRRLASLRRSQETRRSIRAGTDDLDQWVADQLRTGLSAFLAAMPERCRRIAARMVDAKAAALASRIDEMPARLLALPPEERLDAAVAELGKLVLLVRAWRAAPDDPDLARAVATSENREDVVADPASPRRASVFEVVGERIATRRDGLVSHATWLLDLAGGGQPFALLLDFYPASAGRRGSVFEIGARFRADLAFYPSRRPLRAIVLDRQPADDAPPWPEPPDGDPLATVRADLDDAPWHLETPVLLPPGRLADNGGSAWWRADADVGALPLGGSPPAFAFGAALSEGVGIWGGGRLDILSARSQWGRVAFHA